MDDQETQPVRIGYKTGPNRTRPDITVAGGKAGFAGTKNILTAEQKETFRYVVRHLKPAEIHHRNLRGGDEDVCIGIRLSGANICLIGHPGIAKETSAEFANDASRWPVPLPEASKAVVHETDYLIAAPKYMYKNPGGLWFMVNYARSLKKPRVIIWPDGSVDYYDVPGMQRNRPGTLRV